VDGGIADDVMARWNSSKVIDREPPPREPHQSAVSTRRSGIGFPAVGDRRRTIRLVNRSGVALCLAAAVLFGASTPAASVLARDIEPLVLAGLLYLGAALAMVPFVGRSPVRVSALRADARLVLVAIVAGGLVGPALLTTGLTRTSASSASLLLNLELAATVLVAATVYREHLGARMWTAAAVVTAGGGLLVWDGADGWSLGAIAVVGACVCWGFDNGATARIDHVAPHHVTLLKGLVAGSCNLVIGLVWFGAGDATTAQVLGALLVGALGYGASITLWVRGARMLGAARAQVVFATSPFLGAVIAWTFLDDALVTRQLVAMALVLTGVTLSLRSGHEHLHHHDPLDHEHEHEHRPGHPDDHHTHVQPDGFVGRHAHPHQHDELVHAHDHVPDLHHRHPH
jgi:drug/metabolite transporter (DMT)-like permease